MSKHGWNRLAAAAVCAVFLLLGSAEKAAAGTTFHVTPEYTNDASCPVAPGPCGVFVTTSSNNSGDVGTTNPAQVHILLGDSVEFDWSTLGNGSGNDEHSVTRTTGEDNTVHTAGTFDSGIHQTGVSPDPANTGGSWVALDNFELGPSDLNAAGTYFFECFFHGPPMHGIITVAAFGSATHFSVSPSTGTPTAGTPFTVTVTALDRNNNVVTNYGTAINFSSSDGTALFSLNTNWGGGQLIENVTLTKGGSQSVTASNGDGSGTGFVTVQAAGLDHFGITAPATATQGATTSISVSAQDVFNNVKTNYAGTIHFTSSDGAAMLPADSTLPGGSGGFGVIFNTVGTQSISVNDTVTTSATGSTSLTVNSANCPASDKTFSNSTPISIPDVSSAAPYPSPITVSGMNGQVVGKITVTLQGFNHSFPSDIDILLVSPTGQKLILMSDAVQNGIPKTPVDLTFDDAAASAIPQTTSTLAGGSYRPTAYSNFRTPTLNTPAPAGPYPTPATEGSATLESQFAGVQANGVWNLYIQDNVGGDFGAVNGGWSITITPAYASPAGSAITLDNLNSVATNPYPSTIQVSNVPGDIAKVSLLLNGITTNCPPELAVLLQGPHGNIVPMSVVGNFCSGTTFSGINLTLEDDAASALPPLGGSFGSGFFKPASYIVTDFAQQPVLPAPAPAGNQPLAAPDGTATFSAYNGTDPNGTWNLYVESQSQLGPTAGTTTLTGWSLRFELQCATCNASVGASTGTSSTFNQSVMFTGTLTSNFEVPSSGSVTFCDGSASGGICTGTILGTGPLDGTGHATFTTSGLAVGAHSITANFPGDSTYPPATSAALSFTVNKGPTQTFLGSSLNPSTFGQSVKFTANVVPGPFGGSPAGTVTFKDSATTLGSSALSAGTATFTTSALTASGSPHSITAVYGGDASFSASTSSAISQTVNKAASATAVASSLNPSTYGTGVTFTATVTSTAGTPTGTVSFKDGATLLGTSALSAGKATFSTSTLTVGGHSITATYNGAGDYNASVSTTLTQTVNKQSTTTTAIITTPASRFFGQSITFNVSVNASPLGTSVPSGTITFCDGTVTAGVCTGTTLGTGTLTSQTATLTCASGNPCGPLNAGSHSVTAIYGGDGNYTGGTSSAITQTVNKTATTSAITSSVNPSSFGQSVTLTVTVTSAVNGVTSNGNVTFCDGAVTSGACTGTTLVTKALNASGVATLAIASLQTGSHTLNGLYAGSSNFNVSDSTGAPLTQTVNKGATTTTLTVQETPAYLQATQDLFRHQIMLTASVTSAGGTPGCSVTFKDNGVALAPAKNLVGGSATLILPLGLGKIGLHPLTAAYSGCPNFNASTSATVPEYQAPKAH